MKYSNKRKDFYLNKNYALYFYSEMFDKTLDMFIDIANYIGMPKERAIDEAYLFAQAKSSKNCIIPAMIFGRPTEANRYVQTLSKKTINILKQHIEKFKILK